MPTQRMTTSTITRQSQASMPTDWGQFTMMTFAKDANNLMPHILMMAHGTDVENPVNVRIHSECMTGDVFHSRRCDCGAQLDAAMTLIAKKGGIVVYLRQEGRGIGLIEKLNAYNLQDEGYDTIEANTKLGHRADERHYEDAMKMLEDVGVRQIRLLTNNPEKVLAFKNQSIQVIERVPVLIPIHDQNKSYLETKKNVMGHYL